jgi:putative SOS response-associated peptidase YedK
VGTHPFLGEGSQDWVQDGFYEWAKEGKKKFPYCFAMSDDSVFAFAGIWDRWRDPEKKLIETCSIITTSANSLVADIHDRMPVILERGNYDVWLDPHLRKVDDLLDMLKPYQASFMREWCVSPRVNSVVNDDPQCAEEYSPQMLF